MSDKTVKFTIEKNIPIPNGRGGTQYPFAEMEVGDSFTVPIAMRGGATSSARYFTKKMPDATAFKFVSRKDGDELRIWRAA